MFRHMKSYLTCKFVSLSHLSCLGRPRATSQLAPLRSFLTAAGRAFAACSCSRPPSRQTRKFFSVAKYTDMASSTRLVFSSFVCSRPLLPPRLRLGTAPAMSVAFIGRGSASQCPVVWRRRRPLAVEPSQRERPGARLFFDLRQAPEKVSAYQELSPET